MRNLPGAAETPRDESRLRNEGQLLPRSGRFGESDYASAYELVQKASETIDALQKRYRRLDTEMQESNERFRNELLEAQRVIKDWERLATGLKAQLERSEANGIDLQKKLAAVETRTASLERELKASESRSQTSQALMLETEQRARAAEAIAAEEIQLASSFRAKISETFGPARLSSALGSDPQS